MQLYEICNNLLSNVSIKVYELCEREWSLRFLKEIISQAEQLMENLRD